MRQGLTWVLLCLSLSACGGGGGGGAGTGTTPPTTPTTPNPPPAANGRAALAASGYAGPGAQVRFGETYELANDQSLRGTPTSSGMSYAMVTKKTHADQFHQRHYAHIGQPRPAAQPV